MAKKKSVKRKKAAPKRTLKKKAVHRKTVKKVKKVVRKVTKSVQKKAPAPKAAGVVTHFYPNINVCVVEIKQPLAVGDSIMISGHGRSFNQKVTSMQIEHEQIKTAKKGQVIGMKVLQAVKEKDVVYKQ